MLQHTHRNQGTFSVQCCALLFIVAATGVAIGFFLTTTQAHRMCADSTTMETITKLTREVADHAGVTISDAATSDFTAQYGDDLAALYRSARAKRREAHEQLRSLFEGNFASKRDIEAITPKSMESIKDLVFIVCTLNGERLAVPIDAADWPDYYPPTKYGYDAWDLVRAEIERLLKS